MSSFTCGFQQSQKSRLPSEDSVINDSTGASILELAPPPRGRHISVAALPPGHRRVVIAVILSQIFNNLNTGGKCQPDLFSSHYMPVLVTPTWSIHLPFSGALRRQPPRGVGRLADGPGAQVQKATRLLRGIIEVHLLH